MEERNAPDPVEIIRSEVLGDHADSDSDRQYRAVSDFINVNIEARKQAQARLALALYWIKKSESYRRGGFVSWPDFCGYMIRFAPVCSTIREMNTFVTAVEIWLVRLRMPLQVLLEIGPAMLGEIAGAGDLHSVEQAEDWLQRIRTTEPTLLRKEITRQKQKQGCKSA